MTVDMQQLGRNAKEAARTLREVNTAAKNKGLLAIADSLEANNTQILEANARDMEAGREAGLTSALLDRLNLAKRLNGVVADV